jgi:hypothetical protein
MDNIIYLFIGLAFALLVILIITVIAFRNAKPITNNHGTIHNHYYGQEEREEPKVIDDEKLLLLAQCLGEVPKTIRLGEDKIPRRKNRQLEK